MESDKEHCVLFLIERKVLLMHTCSSHKIICETYDKNVIAIRTCVN